jgi:HEAT repeat protein
MEFVWRGWRGVAEAAGVTDLLERRTVAGAVAGIRGRSGRLTVDLTLPEGGSKWAPTVRVGGLLPGLSLRAERPSPPFRAHEARLDMQTGDERFDREVEVHGPEAPLRALLDVETRLLARRLLAGSVDAASAVPKGGRRIEVAINGGELQAVLHEEVLRAANESLAGALRALLDLARRLVHPEDVPARLARNAGSDAEWGVRLRCLLLLVHAYPNDPAAREALRAARGDASEAIRLSAALALGDEGRGLLLEIATAERSDDGRAAQALRALGQHLPRALVLETLGHALRRRRPWSAQACIAWLGRFGGGDAVEPLARVLAMEQGELAAPAARALGETRLAAAEAPLIRALRDAEAHVRLAAVHALSGLGSASAVAPLREAAERYAQDGELKAAARKAVAAIQSRLTGTPGQLSLADGEAGRLALADEDAAGRLTLSPPVPGQTKS